jgi:hypothetical protein
MAIDRWESQNLAASLVFQGLRQSRDSRRQQYRCAVPRRVLSAHGRGAYFPEIFEATVDGHLITIPFRENFPPILPPPHSNRCSIPVHSLPPAPGRLVSLQRGRPELVAPLRPYSLRRLQG